MTVKKGFYNEFNCKGLYPIHSYCQTGMGDL